MKNLYKFEWDYGRQGSIDGLFISEEKDVKNAIGKNVYFGEILGKHSDIYGVIEEGEITEIKVSDSTLNELNLIFKNGNICGYNPLDYVRFTCDRCDEEIDSYDEHYEIEDAIVCQYCATEEEC